MATESKEAPSKKINANLVTYNFYFVPFFDILKNLHRIDSEKFGDGHPSKLI